MWDDVGNMAEPVGRPLKFGTVEELQQAIDSYFESTPEDEWLITGLALHLGTTRKILMEYQERDKFRNTVKAAKLKVESAYEKSLRKNGRAGDIFALKNFGWHDKQELEHSGEVTTTHEYNPAIAAEFEKFLKGGDGHRDT